ncbi:MAG: TadE/TadG family type IV pilus assembly protein [Pseudomonadota bacterium]
MNKSRNGGAAMVELAILLPVLLALFFGLAELGRALLLEHTLLRHTEAAARYLGRAHRGLAADCSENAAWPDARATATHLAVYGNEAGSGEALISGLDADDVTIAVESGGVPGGAVACVVRVSAALPYPGLFGDKIPLLGLDQPTLRAQSEERYVGE